MIYILLSTYIYINTYIEIFLKNKKFIFIQKSLLVLILIGFTGFRFEVGYDYYSYLKIFNEIKKLYFLELFDYKFSEIGFSILNLFYKSYNLLLFSVAIFTIGFKVKVFEKLSYYPLLSFFIYFSINYLDSDFGKLRNAIATTFFLLAILNLNNKKRIIYFILLGSLFHYSLLGTLIIIFTKSKIYDKKKYITIFLFSYMFLGGIVNRLIEIFLIYLPEYVRDKLYYYIFIGANKNLFIINQSLIIRIIFFIYFYYYSKKFNFNEKKYMNIYFYSVCLYPILMIIPELTRIGNYFRVVEGILFAAILKENYSRSKAIIIPLVFFIYCIANIFKIVFINSNEFLPYRNYLFQI